MVLTLFCPYCRPASGLHSCLAVHRGKQKAKGHRLCKVQLTLAPEQDAGGRTWDRAPRQATLQNRETSAPLNRADRNAKRLNGPHRPGHPLGHWALRSEWLYRRVLLLPLPAALPWQGGVGGYHHHYIGEAVEWRPLLLYANPLGHRVRHENFSIKVPSHVTIGCNNEADRLAKIGLHAHPLYPCQQTPLQEATVAITPPPPLKRARTTARENAPQAHRSAAKSVRAVRVGQTPPSEYSVGAAGGGWLERFWSRVPEDGHGWSAHGRRHRWTANDAAPTAPEVFGQRRLPPSGQRLRCVRGHGAPIAHPLRVRTEGIGRVPMRIVSAGTQGKGGGERGGDESDAMDAAPAAVWRRPAQPGRGGRIRCVRWNRLQALRHQTPDTSASTPRLLRGCGLPLGLFPPATPPAQRSWIRFAAPGA